MSSLRGGDDETKYEMENEGWRTENGMSFVTTGDRSDLLKSGIVIFDCTNSVVFRSAAITVAQHEVSHELVTRAVAGLDLSSHAEQTFADSAFIIGHEAMTIGTPTLKTPNTTASARATARYFRVPFIWLW
jgi:hypothetical protein